MALRARGKKSTYYIDIYVNGKRRWKSLGTSDLTLAKKISRELKDSRAQDKFFPEEKGNRITVSELLDMYLELHSKPNKTNPKQDVYYSMKVREYIGNVKLGDLSPYMIEMYRARRRKDRRKNDPKKFVGETMIWHELVLLRHAYNLARNPWGWIKYSPFDQMRLPNPTNQVVAYLDKEQVVALFRVLRDPKLGFLWLLPIVIFARETGARRQNVVDLLWSDVDLERRWLVFRKTKSGKPIGIPMTEAVFMELSKLKEARNRLASAPPTDHVFLNENGLPYKPDYVGRKFKKACRLAGIENFRFHDLRHDCGTSLRKAEVPIADIQEWLGHSNIKMTMKYAHMAGDSSLRDAAKKLEQVRDR